MQTDTHHRWVRVGHSTDASGHVAGGVAARTARSGPDPKLLIAFVSYEYPIHEVVDAIADVAGDVPVIGCTGAGEIGPGPTSDAVRPGVTVVGLGGDFDVTTASRTDFNQRPRQVGEEIAAAMLPLPHRANQFAIMLTDSLAGDEQELIRGAYQALGATVPLVGGVAGDDIRVPMISTSSQIYGGKVLQDAVVAACIGTDGPLGVSVRHGWQCQGEAMMVTASTGNQVEMLDDRPALDVYLERHAAPDGTESDPAVFGRFALTRPLAVVRRDGVAVRHVLGADPERRTLLCAAGVPRGAAVWLATGDVTSTLDAADLAAAESIAALDDAPPLGLLFVDCAGRRSVLGEPGMVAEREVMRRHAGAAPIAGFYSKGEIARVRGANGFHNQTIVAVAIG